MAKANSKRPGGELSRKAVREIFDSHKEAIEVLELLPRYLKERFGRNKDGPFGGFGFFGIERIRVEFTKRVTSIEVENSYASNTATLLVPITKGEPADAREERRKALIAYYMACMPDSQERATAQFYELLKRSGRSKLLQELKHRYRKKHGRK